MKLGNKWLLRPTKKLFLQPTERLPFAVYLGCKVDVIGAASRCYGIAFGRQFVGLICRPDSWFEVSEE